MNAHQLFQQMPASLGQEIVHWMRDQEKEVFKAAVTTLSQQRKLRPVFVLKKPRDQQASWMLETLKLRTTEAVGENVLQVWLMKARSPMLAAFLDDLGVSHDGKGGVESDLPATLDAGKVAAGVARLLESFPPAEVAVYLHLFQLQQPGGWPEIAAILTENKALHFAPAGG
jgi:hypothetical protein